MKPSHHAPFLLLAMLLPAVLHASSVDPRQCLSLMFGGQAVLDTAGYGLEATWCPAHPHLQSMSLAKMKKIDAVRYRVSKVTGLDTLDSPLCRTVFTYDSLGRTLSETSERWNANSGNWTVAEGYFSTYDQRGWLLTKAHLFWDSASDTSHGTEEKHYYDGQGNDTQVVNSAWDGTTYQFDDVVRTISNTFDHAGNLVSALSQYGPGRIPEARNEYTYDASGHNVMTVMLVWDPDRQLWFNFRRYSSAFDGQGNVLTYSTEAWHAIALVWLPIRVSTYTYNGGRLDSEQLQVRDTNSTTWTATTRDLYTYGPQGSTLRILRETFDTALNVFIPVNRADYAYGQQGNHISTTLQKWDTTNNSWLNTWMDSDSSDAFGMTRRMAAYKWETDNWQETSDNTWYLYLSNNGEYWLYMSSLSVASVVVDYTTENSSISRPSPSSEPVRNAVRVASSSNGVLRVSWNNPEAQSLSVEVFDTRGRSCAVLARGLHRKGSGSVSRRMLVGSYIVKFSSDRFSGYQRVVVK